jgi:hypothetical protein
MLDPVPEVALLVDRLVILVPPALKAVELPILVVALFGDDPWARKPEVDSGAMGHRIAADPRQVRSSGGLGVSANRRAKPG